jgi:hypothetical protein
MLAFVHGYAPWAAVPQPEVPAMLKWGEGGRFLISQERRGSSLVAGRQRTGIVGCKKDHGWPRSFLYFRYIERSS